MPPEALAVLRDICDAGEIILRFTAGVSKDGYVNDIGVQSVVERQFIVIGEAMTRLRNKHPTVFTQIADAKAIIDFRNLLVHGYDLVNDERVWRIVQGDLQPLLDQVRRVLQHQP